MQCGLGFLRQEINSTVEIIGVIYMYLLHYIVTCVAQSWNSWTYNIYYKATVTNSFKIELSV